MSEGKEKMCFIRNVYVNSTDLVFFIVYTVLKELMPYLLQVLVMRTDV